MYLTDQYYDLEDLIENVNDYINENDRFNVAGWYKCGLVNDQFIVAGCNNNQRNARLNNNDNQVDSGPINYHPCYIQPTTRDYPATNFKIGQALLDLIFGVSTFDLQLKNVL